MKNLKWLSALIIGLIYVGALSAQNDIAFVDLNTEKSTISAKKVNAVSIDKTGILELSKILDDQISISASDLGYANEVRLRLQVSLNKKGEIIASHIIGNDPTGLGNTVIRTLSGVEKVTPIKFNGQARAQTIQIPLVFK